MAWTNRKKAKKTESKMCRQCRHDCKQPPGAYVIVCPKFEPKK